MSRIITLRNMIKGLRDAADVLRDRQEEVNKLNVFPLPDGDTGTNMSLTVDCIISAINELPEGAQRNEVSEAITHGALMGARGNSGVITSQIFRGICEVMGQTKHLNVEAVDKALKNAVKVSFKAVRKPVEGTILTVLRDTSEAASHCRKKGMHSAETLEYIAEACFKSVKHTPELLPVLKENGVVDAGGFGLSILVGAFKDSLVDGQVHTNFTEILPNAGANIAKVEIEQINDWAGSRFRYCTEFLLNSKKVKPKASLGFLHTIGDCELLVGDKPLFKVHVHSDHPDRVLKHFLEVGQISEVHIHNMQLQSEERIKSLGQKPTKVENGEKQKYEMQEPKEVGFLSVCTGEGNKEILESLGVDVVVYGGQTMNPSTQELYDAATSINAKQVFILPNNQNITMAAKAVCNLVDFKCADIPTKSVPAVFSALLCYDEDESFDDNVKNMTEAAENVSTGELTIAVKDSKDDKGDPIKEGNYIGIGDGAILTSGPDIQEVIMELFSAMHADEKIACTILAGEELSDEKLESFVSFLEKQYPGLEIDSQRGGQPLYHVVFGLE
ncbi:MAG: DAK2 domain-containing protein [Eggerthellaceae bacterium]|nr:DAK2 domain-containing protein [Eggerthellaceae bacterium]